MERTLSIQSDLLTLAATLHYPRQIEGALDEKYPLIIICHGFTGNRIGPNRLFVNAARKWSEAGYVVLRFDFGGCGESTGDYGENGMDFQIKQIRHVLDYALDMDLVDHERVILVGHSLGGAASILTAAKDRRIKTLVLWAPVAHPFNDIVKITGKAVYEQCVAEGSSSFSGYRFKPSFFTSLTELHPYEELSKFNGDVLLVHGTADEVIPVDYSFLYQKAFRFRNEGVCEKEIIFQGDHSFSEPEHSDAVITKTKEWLAEQEQRKLEWCSWTI